jgi:hypothetical protein
MRVAPTYAAAALAAALFLAAQNGASAHPSYIPMNPNGASVGDGSIAAIGHQDPRGGGSVNPYGGDFAGADHRWSVELCVKDSDGDGLTNGFELGDPCCVWAQGGPAPAYTADISHPGLATGKFAQPATRVCTDVPACTNPAINPCGAAPSPSSTPAPAPASPSPGSPTPDGSSTSTQPGVLVGAVMGASAAVVAVGLAGASALRRRAKGRRRDGWSRDAESQLMGDGGDGDDGR